MRLLFVFACFLTFEFGITLSEVMSQQKTVTSSMDIQDFEFLTNPDSISNIKKLQQDETNHFAEEVIATATRWLDIKKKLDRDLAMFNRLTKETNEALAKQKTDLENAQIEYQLSQLRLIMSNILLVAAVVLGIWYLYLAFLKFRPNWYVVRKMHRMLMKGMGLNLNGDIGRESRTRELFGLFLGHLQAASHNLDRISSEAREPRFVFKSLQGSIAVIQKSVSLFGVRALDPYTSPLSEISQKLNEINKGLEARHKALVDAERHFVERVNQRVSQVLKETEERFQAERSNLIAERSRVKDSLTNLRARVTDLQKREEMLAKKELDVAQQVLQAEEAAIQAALDLESAENERELAANMLASAASVSQAE